MSEIRKMIFEKSAGPASLNEQARTIQFVASTENVDRMGDQIVIAGVDTTAFMRNPVILWAHDSSSLPVGKAINVAKTGKQLLVTVEFAPEDANPQAEQCFKLCKGGYLNAVSVGFIPKKSEMISDADSGFPTGWRYLESELLEISVVPVPANSEAVSRAAGTPPAVAAFVKSLFAPKPKTPPKPSAAMSQFLEKLFSR